MRYNLDDRKGNGKMSFFPYDDEPLTEEEGKALQKEHEDIENNRVKPWEQVKKELEL